MLRGIGWGWVVLGAIVAELAFFPVAFLHQALLAGLGSDIASWIIPVEFFAVMLIVGVLVGWRVRSRPALNGALAGLAAAVLILPLMVMSPPPHPFMEALNEAAKVLGGALGGALAGWRRTAAAL